MKNEDDIKRDYISLDQLIERNDHFPANKKFFELLEKHKKEERQGFVKEWNNWVESDKNKDLTLDFSNFHFDINNKEVKEKFAILTKGNCWNFINLHFPRMADFSYATFEGEANFHFARFKGEANFSVATFKEKAYFSRAKFKEKANFSGATFKEKANFSVVIFEREAYFYDATFEKYVYFIIMYSEKNEEIRLGLTKFNNKSFFNMKFLSRANLSDAFVDVNNINLFRNVEIKKIKKDPNNYRLFRRYYASKLDHDSERECFALELESKLPLERQKNKNLYSNILYLLKSYFHHFFRTLYKWISNYGESIVIPILVLFFYIYPIISIWNWQNYFEVVKCNLPFTNIEGCLNGLSKFFGKSFTYIGLFLSGLAIRNKFKIK
jgi:hypothetical protein